MKKSSNILPSSLHSFFRIGALSPSSPQLASVMTRYIRNDKKRVLEVGAGTGPITRAIAKKISSQHHVDVVEILPQFASLLRKRFQKESAIQIHCSNILNFRAEPYSTILSSLPFNAFPPEQTEQIFEHLINLCENDAIISFFEYKILENIVPYVTSKKRQEYYYASRFVIDRFIARFKFDEAKINLNLPPAVVHYLRIDKSTL